MSAPTLDIRGLSAGYRGRDVLSNLTLEGLKGGEMTALVGPNGSGKSTLLRAIAGLLSARGSVMLGDDELLCLAPAQRARRLNFLSQNIAPNVPVLVIEAAIAALKVGQAGRPAGEKQDAKRLALSALVRLGISDLAFKPLNELSGGERQLAALAPIVAKPAPLILLDEPTSALDMRNQLEIMGVVAGLAAEGAIVVIVLHDLELAARWSQRIAVLHAGRIHSAGTPGAVLTREMLAEVYAVEARIESCSLGGLKIMADTPLADKRDWRPGSLNCVSESDTSW